MKTTPNQKPSDGKYPFTMQFCSYIYNPPCVVCSSSVAGVIIMEDEPAVTINKMRTTKPTQEHSDGE